MKKLLLTLIALTIIFSGLAQAKTYHLFLVDTKQDFVYETVTYQAWKIGTDPINYFMLASDPRPEEPPVVIHNINLLASAGGQDMLYWITNDTDLAEEINLLPEYAGGSSTTTVAAWVDFTVRSAYQRNAHAQFPIMKGANITLNVRWKLPEPYETDEDGNPIMYATGDVQDWVDAGFPDPSIINPSLTVFGVE